MEKNTLVIFKSDINAQLKLIQTIYQKLLERANGLGADDIIRHFFRHAYGTAIEYEQLKINLDKALNLLPNLEQDIKDFIQQLTEE